MPRRQRLPPRWGQRLDRVSDTYCYRAVSMAGLTMNETEGLPWLRASAITCQQFMYDVSACHSWRCFSEVCNK